MNTKDMEDYFAHTAHIAAWPDVQIAGHFDLLTKYEIYKNLNVYLEASYIISDFDKKEAVNYNGTKSKLSEDDWRAELIFVYDF